MASVPKAGRVLWVVVAGLALLNGGCLLAVAGAAAGAGAAASYVYYNGQLTRDYPADLGDVQAAVRTSLLELQFPVLSEQAGTAEGYLTTKTTDGSTVRISLEVLPSRIPAEGSLTRVSVRVGVTGDDAVSARILDQVGRHLVVPVGPAPAPQGVTPAVARPAPGPRETAPPPLAK